MQTKFTSLEFTFCVVNSESVYRNKTMTANMLRKIEENWGIFDKHKWNNRKNIGNIVNPWNFLFVVFSKSRRNTFPGIMKMPTTTIFHSFLCVKYSVTLVTNCRCFLNCREIKVEKFPRDVLGIFYKLYWFLCYYIFIYIKLLRMQIFRLYSCYIIYWVQWWLLCCKIYLMIWFLWFRLKFYWMYVKNTNH